MYYNPYESFDPHDGNGRKPEDRQDRTSAAPRKRRLGPVLKGLLGLVLVCAVSLASVAGYIWYDNNYGVSLPGRSTQAAAQKVVYYQLGSSEGAMTVPQIYEKNLPSVVLFTCEIASADAGSYFDFFGQGQNAPKTTQIATGTGIVMSKDGYIITNNHVVDGASKIKVTLWDGSEYQAKVIGADENTDIAVVKIDAKDLTPAEFGDSDQMIVGENAIVIGNPLGQSFAETLTVGYISATERTLTIGNSMMTLIQTDASVNPGNSGGPLINSRGQVVGVINSKISQDDVEGLGFAIPINTALRIANDYIDHGYVASRPMLGITVQSVSDEQAAYYNIEAGITVKEVVPGSCAEKAGMKVGDKIVAVNNVAVDSSAELNYQKGKYKIGETITISVEREGSKLDLSVKLEGGTGQ